MTVLASRPIYDQVLAALRADPGLPEVGDGRTPDAAGQAWIVMHPRDEQVDGPLGDVHADGTIELQLSCWAPNRRHAQETRDLARAVMTDRAGLSTVDRTVLAVTVLPGPTVRDDTTGSPSLWQSVDIYRLTTSPT